MSEWAAVQLSSATWHPEEVLVDQHSTAPASYSGPTVALEEVARSIPATEPLSKDCLVASPGSVDAASGALRKLAPGRMQLGYLLSANLETGDVLVPVLGSGPCILVDDAYRDVAFADFFALRPERIDSSMLWAYLTCASGSNLRARLQHGGIRPRLRLRSLLSASLPALPATEAKADRALQQLPPERIRLAAPMVKPSHWSTIDLTAERDWWRPVALLGLEQTGTCLGDIAEIRGGRLSAKDITDIPLPDSLPVADPRWVRQMRSADRWGPRASGVPVPPGTVVLSLIGRRQSARVVQEPMLLSRMVAALIPREEFVSPNPTLSTALTSYLNSDAGQLVLQNLSSGLGTAHRISLRHLADVPVPDPQRMARSGIIESGSTPLPERLERLLWNS